MGKKARKSSKKVRSSIAPIKKAESLFSDIPTIRMGAAEKISWYFSHYNRLSLGSFIFLASMYAMVAYYWRSIILTDNLKDPLLWSIWAFMTAILCWNIDAKRDLSRMAVGLVGGLMIEAWGTQTSIWTYYTNERPPLWIIPAWPVAAIAIDRIARMIDLLCSQLPLEKLWWIIVFGFTLLMANFVWPYLDKWTTIGAFAIVIATFVMPGDRRQDVTLMLAGAGLGVFLEYWGTSRQCWIYYTHEVPPVFAVFAHGIAAISFQRGAVILLSFIENFKSWLKKDAEVA